MIRFWKKRTGPIERKGLAQAALRGASHEEFVQEALNELVATSRADRIGVWLEASSADGAERESAFHGGVWDRESESTPPEWRTLSPDIIFPLSQLLSGLVVETNFKERESPLLVGPVAGLRAAAWAAVQHAGKLRGILLAGTLAGNREFQKESLRSVATELALALALETERRVANERHADIVLCNRIITSLNEPSRLQAVVQEIVDSCVAQRGRCVSPGASFALVGRVNGSEENREDAKPAMTVLCLSEGKTAAPHVSTEPVRMLAKRALENQRITGNEVSTASQGEARQRIVAIPIGGDRNSGTVLLAGFSPGLATLGSVERLELRGKLLGAVLSAIDAREIANEQRQRERAILEASREPIVLLGPQGVLADSNRGARRLLLSLPPALGEENGPVDSPLPLNKEFPEFFRVRDREKVASWQQSQGPSGGESLEVELDRGARVRLRSQAAGGEFQAVALVPAELPTSAEENRAQVELLGLVEWLDQGVILFDAKENLRLMNLRFAQMTGLAPTEVEGYKTLDSLIERLREQSAEPKLFAHHWRDMARRAEGGEREEIHLVRPAAKVLERASRPILDLNGKKVGRIELYRDLTAQRLFQAKLLQTERLAALGQMVSGVAHELSNPLTSILGYAQRLLLQSDAGKHFEEIRRIFSEAERAGAILRRMLLAARESGPERKLVPLNSVIQRTIELQRFSLAAERIGVDLQLEANLPDVFGDAGQLQQVMMNLLGNARQAIEGQGHGGTIRVRTQRAENNSVRVEVSDSGPGIPEGILARIFDPFFTTKPAGVGTGLGLAIVLSLVREHGGQVHVSSPRGSGAVFVVELPAAEQKNQARLATFQSWNPPSSVFAESRPPIMRSTTQRVLVVEDEPTVAQLISDVLRDEGFESEILLDGRDAAGRISRETFDLIVCDMKMPNLDGQTLYESLISTKKFLQKRFLFVTGDVLGAKTHDFLTKNQLPHVAKPFRVEELLEKVHEVLQPAGSAGPRRVTPLRKNTATKG